MSLGGGVLTATSEQQLANLKRALGREHGFALFLVVAEGLARTETIDRLRAWSGRDGVSELTFLPGGKDAGRSVQALLDGAGPANAGVVIPDGDALIAEETPLVSLNTSRDRLGRWIGGPLVLVMGSRQELLVRRLAPDLFDVRAGTYAIEAIPRPVAPQGRWPLTITLRREGSELHRAYHVPALGPIEGDVPGAQPLAEIGRGYHALGRVGLDALREVLRRGQPADVERDLAGEQLDRAGALFFELLFGADVERVQRVLRAVAPGGEAYPNPIRFAVRARILTGLPELLDLPFRVTRWQSYLLRDYGWTFEVCTQQRPTARVDHRNPSRVLLIAPAEAQEGPPIEVDRHIDDVRSLLDTISPGFGASGDLLLARTREEITRALRDGPSFVYFYGHAEVRGAEPHLRVGVGEWVPVRDFAEMLRERPPHAVFLNGSFPRGALAAGHALLPGVPFVLADTASAGAGADAARRYALDWIESWLGRGFDPVESAHVKLSSWTPAVVYADYDTFATQRPARTAVRPENAEHWLDRDRQRAIAYKHIADLVRHERQRVEAIVAYGRPGNGIERLSQQIIDFVEREGGDRIHVKRLAVPFPDALGIALRDEHFDLALKARLGVDPRGALGRALLLKAPLPQGDTARVLWLDWGVLRRRKSYRDEIDAWLRYARDVLAAAPLEGFRVVASLAIEAEGEAFEALAQSLPDLRSDPDLWTDRFRCSAVEPLDRVSKADLLSFLEAHGCDPGDLRDLADGIWDDTEGAYDATTLHLRDGLRLGWRVLRRRFPDRPRARSRKL